VLPTLPSAVQSGLQPGAYVLEVTGTDAEGGNPQLPGCAPSGLPPAGKRVTSSGTVDRDGDAWVFRSERPGSSLTLRLRVATRSFSTELFAVDGTLGGSAPDEATGLRAASGVTMEVGDAAVVDGEIRLTGAFVTALVLGPVTFSDTAGRATCNRVALAMQPGRAR
jgi:hypothetical protein